VVVLGLWVCLAGQGIAGPIVGVNGLEGLGQFEGDFEYKPESATLLVKLVNTSPVGNGGYLTAIAFNNPGSRITGAILSSTNTNFGLLGLPSLQNGVSGSPFGDFDLGASVGGSFLAGGSPSLGVGVGDSVLFTFTFTGTELDKLTAKSFFDTLSSSASAGQGPRAFVARFRGFDKGGSDKVPGDPGAIVDPPPGGIKIVSAPEPASLTLAGIALICLTTRRFCRSRREKRLA
jgi:hypothetical protein